MQFAQQADIVYNFRTLLHSQVLFRVLFYGNSFTWVHINNIKMSQVASTIF